jgi:hypothetical protein
MLLLPCCPAALLPCCPAALLPCCPAAVRLLPPPSNCHTAAAVADGPRLYLDPCVLREVLLGAVGFVEQVVAERARSMRPPELQGTDASVQVGCCLLV